MGLLRSEKCGIYTARPLNAGKWAVLRHQYVYLGTFGSLEKVRNFYHHPFGHLWANYGQKSAGFTPQGLKTLQNG